MMTMSEKVEMMTMSEKVQITRQKSLNSLGEAKIVAKQKRSLTIKDWIVIISLSIVIIGGIATSGGQHTSPAPHLTPREHQQLVEAERAARMTGTGTIEVQR
jgi:hypothetical protein